jgi:uncharacterized protein (DUF1501 family)
MPTNLVRREFLKRVAQYGALGTAAPLGLSLSSLAHASSPAATDYKAVVCVYLYGGNDYANTVVPYDSASYNLYNNLRSSIALTRSSLASTVLSPTQPLSGGLNFALAPNLSSLMPLFNNNQMAVLLNIGTLIQPTTKAKYLANAVALPPRLFSHNDQQKFSQAMLDPGVSGWGGRLEDLLMSNNATSTFNAISASGNALFLSGSFTNQYQVSTNGPIAINALTGTPFGNSAVSSALRSIITTPPNQILSDQLSSYASRSINAQGTLASVIGSSTPFGTTFPANNSLASQLQIVARIIKANQSLGVKRQVFFVSLGGFDTHDHLPTIHPQLMATLGSAIAAFQTAVASMSLTPNVLTFTSSDFGRTLTSNGDGTDHGWGSHQFVFGGPITSSKFIGTPPALANNGPDDLGQGRLIPTTSNDQLAYSIGKWLGASDSDLKGALPNALNFSALNF